MWDAWKHYFPNVTYGDVNSSADVISACLHYAHWTTRVIENDTKHGCIQSGESVGIIDFRKCEPIFL